MAHYPTSQSGDEERRARRLDWPVPGRALGLVIAPLVGGHFLGEHPAYQLDVFAEAVDALPRLPIRHADHDGRWIDADPRAQTELDAAVRDVIEGEDLAGQHRRVAQWN